jgi:hypothetical protein
MTMQFSRPAEKVAPTKIFSAEINHSSQVKKFTVSSLDLKKSPGWHQVFRFLPAFSGMVTWDADSLEQLWECYSEDAVFQVIDQIVSQDLFAPLVPDSRPGQHGHPLVRGIRGPEYIDIEILPAPALDRAVRPQWKPALVAVDVQPAVRAPDEAAAGAPQHPHEILPDLRPPLVRKVVVKVDVDDDK